MMLGLTLVNIAPRRSRETFDLVKKFSSPIFVLFFVLAGARLKLADMSFWAWSLVVVYVIGRTIGKISGAYLGAIWSGAAATVRRYLGMCLFAQGGIAIGLSIVAGHRFDKEISSIVMLVVTATTFIVQILGPLFIRSGVKKAGEIGMNVTEEDLLGSYRVRDVMETRPVLLYEGTSLREVVRIIGDTSSFYYAMVDNDGRLAGCVTFDGLRNTFATQEINDWLVALDIAEPVIAKITPESPLSEAIEQARRKYVDYLPVVSSPQDQHLVGILEIRSVQRRLSAEVLARQQKADSDHIPQQS
jgi:CBS domain-containing protein